MSPADIFREKLIIFVISENKNSNCILILNICFFYFFKACFT